jgi:DNA-binding protein YbaB
VVELSEENRVDPRMDFLDRLKAKTDERRAAVESARQAVAGLTAEVRSPDRLVTVKVSPQGALLDLQLDHEALELEPTDLAALILETTRAATAKVAEDMRAAVAPLEEPLDLGPLGAGSEPPPDADPR